MQTNDNDGNVDKEFHRYDIRDYFTGVWFNLDKLDKT